jgi:hypothetical protein
VAVHDNRNSQSGDHTSRDAAGRDITHQGADATEVLSFLKEYVFAADQRTETTIKEMHRELRLSRGDMVIIGDALRTVRDRVDDLIVDRDVDKLEREDRQAELDAKLAQISAEQRRARRVLFWFAAGILIAFLVEAWLLYDRYTALSVLRYWTGGGLAWALWRGR